MSYSKNHVGILLLLTVSLLFSVGFIGTAGNPVVIATTPIGQNFARQIGGNYFEVRSIVTPGLCPAHYDLTPSDYGAVEEAKLVVSHGFEPWLEDLIRASGSESTPQVKLGGGWNLPSRAIGMIEKLSSKMAEVDPEHADYYQKQVNSLQEEIRDYEKEVQRKAEKLDIAKARAIVMEFQKGFVKWLGAQVVETFPSQGMVSAKLYSRLVNVGKEEGVDLVISNLPSGIAFGQKLAHQIGAVHVILPNFPGSLHLPDSYLKMMEYKAQRVFESFKFARAGRKPSND